MSAMCFASMCLRTVVVYLLLNGHSLHCHPPGIFVILDCTWFNRSENKHPDCRVIRIFHLISSTLGRCCSLNSVYTPPTTNYMKTTFKALPCINCELITKEILVLVIVRNRKYDWRDLGWAKFTRMLWLEHCYKGKKKMDLFCNMAEVK